MQPRITAAAGPTGSALFAFDATLTGIENLEQATAIVEAANVRIGLIIDSAPGTLAVSRTPADGPNVEAVEAVAIRSLLY